MCHKETNITLNRIYPLLDKTDKRSKTPSLGVVAGFWKARNAHAGSGVQPPDSQNFHPAATSWLAGYEDRNHGRDENLDGVAEAEFRRLA